MFYIRLPYFYQNYKFNTFFKNYITAHSESLAMKFSINYCYGAFPWSIWNGGHNVHTEEAVLVPQMQDLFLQTNTPICIDWSNTLLQEQDIYDIHENATLRTLKYTGSACEVSDLAYMNYIQTQDKTLKIIISDKAQVFAPFNESIINTFCEQESIELININSLNGYDISKLSNKAKIEITVGCCSKCPINTQLQCALLEQNNIYNYDGNSIYLNCKNIQKPINYLDAIMPMLHQGITHFKLETSLNNLNEFNLSLLTSFIKPECLGEYLSEYYRYCQ